MIVEISLKCSRLSCWNLVTFICTGTSVLLLNIPVSLSEPFSHFKQKNLTGGWLCNNAKGDNEVDVAR